MSRLPFRPGDGPSRTLPKLRFDGVEPGSDEATELARVFAKQIDQFYHKSAQAHELGGVDQSRAHRQLEDMHMSYTNQFGEETIRVKLAKGVRQRHRHKTRRLPNWALVEFSVPIQFDFPLAEHDEKYQPARFMVRAQMPQQNPVTTTPRNGDRNEYGGSWTEDLFSQKHHIKFAKFWSDPTGEVVGTGLGDTYTVAMLVDLRPYHTPEPTSPVLVDVWALLESTQYRLYGYTNTFSDNVPTGDPHPTNLNEPGGHIVGDWEAWGTAGYPYTYTRWYDPYTGAEVNPLEDAMPPAMTSTALVDTMPRLPYIKTTSEIGRAHV